MDICTHKKDALSKHFDLISPLRIRDPQGFLFFPFVLTSRHVSLSHVSHMQESLKGIRFRCCFCI